MSVIFLFFLLLACHDWCMTQWKVCNLESSVMVHHNTMLLLMPILKKWFKKSLLGSECSKARCVLTACFDCRIPDTLPSRLANPARRHYLWKTDLEKLIFKEASDDMWRQLRWGLYSLSWTGAGQIWYPVILPLKWRQDQQLPSL